MVINKVGMPGRKIDMSWYDFPGQQCCQDFFYFHCFTFRAFVAQSQSYTI